MNPVRMEKFLRRMQRLPCCGDDAVFDARKNLVPRFGCFRNFAACARSRCSLTAGGALTPCR